jgi:hypothetical protein
MQVTSTFAARLRRAAYLRVLVAGAVFAYCASPSLWAQTPSKTANAQERIGLKPKLLPGQVLRYQVQLQTVTDTKRTGAISDPEGPARLAVTWDATIKLEVLGAAAASAGNPQAPKPSGGDHATGGLSASAKPLRIRTTYEHSAAGVKSDSPDPEAQQIQQSYSRLEGQVLEFTVGTDGHVSDVRGLEGIIDDEKVRQGAEQWISQVSGPAVSAQGVVMGQTWNSAQPATSMPLTGMIWRSNSTYLRNESCQPAESNGTGASGELCAVILTRQSIIPQKKERDPTPEDYRRNGLRTSGKWSGSGESLSYVSLQTHLAVSVTQNSSQQIDFTVTNASGRSIRYAGNIETHSRVELLPEEAGNLR